MRQGGRRAGAPPSRRAADFAVALKDRVTTDAMMAHLKKLQDIADANGGNRALGHPGYDASVDYVVQTLRDKGFDVKTDDFEVRIPFADEPVVTVGGQRVKAAPLNYTVGTPAGGGRRAVGARPHRTPARMRGVGLRRARRQGCRRPGRPRRLPVRRQAGRGRRARGGRRHRREQRRRRRDRRRHPRGGHRGEDSGRQHLQGRRRPTARNARRDDDRAQRGRARGPHAQRRSPRPRPARRTTS